MHALQLALFVVVAGVGCFGQEVPGCKSKSTCSECIQKFGCVWCSDPLPGKDHCISTIESVSEQWCRNPNKITSPQKSFEILEDQPLRSPERRDENAIQIRPQRVKLRLRRDEEHQITFQYKQASNYPVDLYYLMDLSKSMSAHKNKLSVLGTMIASTMRNLTNNFRLGFGSFVDKVSLPFVSTEPMRLKQPCDGCAPAYSFKNHKSLSEDENRFSQEVKQARVSGNLDSPEGGFDALMQVMTCMEEIGWRSQARRLIVFFTDEAFHISGDGKLAGVVEPNDGQCHMKNNMYTHSLVYDYPSISHINYVAKLNNFNLIFAVAMTHSTTKTKQYVRRLYGELERIIENSKSTVVYDDGDDVVNSIRDNYNRIVRSIVMTIPNHKNDVQVRFSSNCKEPIANGAGCNNTGVTEILDFTATIKPTNCPKDGRPIVLQIQPGTVKEYLTVELEVVCECDCEDAGHVDFESDSERCSGNGDLKCGVCSCKEERFGTKCECDRRNSTSTDTTTCMKHPNDTMICSGQGTCKCGQCICDTRNSQPLRGKYCDCDDYSCKRTDNKLCSGEDRGVCECGICKCLSGWRGDACQCPDDDRFCVDPRGDGQVCSGRGKCDCGRCKCDPGEFSGKYCEECPTCPGHRCEELRPCVECFIDGFANCSSLNCSGYGLGFVEEVREDASGEKKLCTFPDEARCTVVYQYYSEGELLTAEVQREKVCPEGPDVLGWILGVTGSIILAGLIMLIVWKVVTTIHDRKEYAKFENERAKARWHRGENPLYKPIVTTFKNPMYKDDNRLSDVSGEKEAKVADAAEDETLHVKD